jgi:uncharacterized protein (DUF433 family)
MSHILTYARTVVDNAQKSVILQEDGDMKMGNAQQAADKLLRTNIDWSQCNAVVRTPGTVSGQWRVKGTRIPVSAVIENYNSGYEPEALATRIFIGLPVESAREIIKYAAERS